MIDRSMRYPHRLNEEGSYDSICRLCYATVARGKAEDELLAYETAHVCDPFVMMVHAQMVLAQSAVRLAASRTGLELSVRL